MARDDAPLPLFPLANVVIFPRIQVPLHIFEPRYRQMVEHVLASDRRIGMAVVRPEHAVDMRGNPPVFPIGCTGVIARSQKLPDGRYNIVLGGAHRFRIASEQPTSRERLFRVAEIETLEDQLPPEDVPRVAALRAKVGELMAELLNGMGAAARASSERLARLDDVTFTNALCNALSLPALEKQRLLEADRISARLERLVAALHFRVAERGTPAAPGSDLLH